MKNKHVEKKRTTPFANLFSLRNTLFFYQKFLRLVRRSRASATAIVADLGSFAATNWGEGATNWGEGNLKRVCPWKLMMKSAKGHFIQPPCFRGEVLVSGRVLVDNIDNNIAEERSWGIQCSMIHFGNRSKYSMVCLRSTPHPVTVTTRIIAFLVGNPYKPSFATVTGWGVHRRYVRKRTGWELVEWFAFALENDWGKLDPDPDQFFAM